MIYFRNVLIINIKVFTLAMCFTLCSFGQEKKDFEERFRRISERMKFYFERSSDKVNLPLREIPEKQINQGSNLQKAPSSLNISFKTTPILGQHIEFSPEWWGALLSSCNKCDEQKFDTEINCEKLLSKNPQWQEVQRFPQTTKDIIMQRVLTDLPHESIGLIPKPENETKKCNLACIICAGGDPNIRSDDTHTALHYVSEAQIRPHFGLFKLLLEKGANPNTKCQPAHPWFFAGSKGMEWQEELKKYGGCPPEDDDNL